MSDDGWRPIETAPKDGTMVLTSKGVGFPTWSAKYDAVRPPGEPKDRWAEYGPRWQRIGFCDVGYEPEFWKPIPQMDKRRADASAFIADLPDTGD